MIIKRQKVFTKLRTTKKILNTVAKSALEDMKAGVNGSSKKTQKLMKKVKALDMKVPKTEGGRKAMNGLMENLENRLNTVAKPYKRKHII